MTLGVVWSFVFGAMAALALTLNAWGETSHPLRFGMVLIILAGLHLFVRPRLLFRCEAVLYLILMVYMSLSLLWTLDMDLAMDTLLLSLNFILVLVLYSALMNYYDPRAVLAGTLAGFLLGAAIYTLSQGFPFVYPEGFSYNTIAGMYLFGLIITALFGWHMRLTILPILVALVLLLHIAATTSIKTNVGILLGVMVASLLYFRSTARLLRRILIPLVAFVGLMVYAIVSNDALVERVQAGVERVSTGIEILMAREDASDTTSLDARERWANEGLQGWARNPLFGHGVEAFRADYGITSHSTPIDLLYNAGAIGLILFYGTLISIGWRLSRANDPNLRSLRALISAGLVCYLFISLSGTVYYDNFLAAFVGISSVLLRQPCRQPVLSRQADESEVTARRSS